jgi:hypothetical protein
MRLTYLMRKKKIRSLFLQFSPYVVPWRSRRVVFRLRSLAHRGPRHATGSIR